MFGGAGSAKGGGTVLGDDEIIKLAANHPDWFAGKDLCHLLSVAETLDGVTFGEEFSAAREDLRALVAFLHAPGGKGEEVAYAA